MMLLHGDATDKKGNVVKRGADVGLPGSGGWVPFQFPLIVKSDNKQIEWEETNLRNIEPLVVFKGSKAREIHIEWHYIVTGSSIGRGDQSWTAESIASIVKKIRGFFYMSMFSELTQNSMAVQFRAYDVVGSPHAGISSFSFRSDGVDVKYGDVLINDAGTIFPLRTDLSMKLKLWSKAEDKNKKAMLNMEWLKSANELVGNPEWY